MNDQKQRKFLSLYEPVHARFERFCRARAGGQMEYRDLMNESLLIAFQKFETIKSEKAFLSFLIGISIRLMANLSRKKHEIAYTAVKSINNSPCESRTDVQAEIYLLHQAMAKLPDNQKESIILYEITGYSVKEIAAMHSVSESAVKKRLERGRKKLLQLLMCTPLLIIVFNKNSKASNTYLDDLFDKARWEPPHASFEEIGQEVTNAIVPGNSGGSLSLFSKSSLLSKGAASFVFLAIITLVYLGFNQPSSDNYIRSSFVPPIEIDFLTAGFQTKAGLTLNRSDDREILTASISIQSHPEIAIKANPSTRIANEITLPKHEDIIVVPRLNIYAVSTNHPRPQLLQKPTLIAPKPKQPTLTPVTFVINERTSTQKLASISNKARYAGIEYTYVVDLHKTLIREFHVDMSIPGTDLVSSVQISVPKKESFEITFGWFVDANGQALKMTENVVIADATSKHTLQVAKARKLCRIYQDEGIEYLETHFEYLIENAKFKGPEEFILNTVGYIYFKQHAYEKAIEIFKLNARLFPEKENPWDSLGEALYAFDDKESALKAFQKALSINPKFNSSQKWVSKIDAELY